MAEDSEPRWRVGAGTPLNSLPAVHVTITLPDDNDGPVVVHLRGELDVAEVRTVRDTLAPIVARADRDLTVDVGDLRFIDVGGVNLLAETAATLTAAQRVVRLRAPSRILMRMLEVTRLDERFQIVEASGTQSGHPAASSGGSPS